MRLLIGVVVVMSMGLALAFAQTPLSGVSVAKVTTLDPALDAIVPANAKFEILVEEYFGGSEGPVWMSEGPSGYGYLLFSDQPGNRIYKWDGKLSVFLEPAGYTGPPDKAWEVALLNMSPGVRNLMVGNIGSNGLTVDREGRLVICARGDRALHRIEKDGKRTVLADRYQGKGLDAPNDVVVKSDGAVYFSTTAGIRTRAGTPPPDVAPDGLYRWKEGSPLQLLITQIQGARPNGLAFSPDEKVLYVVMGGKIWRFDVQPDGTIANGRFFSGESEADGMKVDRNGNLYFPGPDGLWIVGPDGKHLGTIATGLFRNLAFGDADRKTLYMTIIRGLARIRLNIPGL
jgi:gluconolactonase